VLALGSVRQGLFKSPDEQVDHADLALKQAGLTERDDMRL
jgi:hypothetical protein